MLNKTIANIFREIAEILEIKGENRFRIRAYQRATQNIEGLSEDVADLIKQDRLRDIPGIGEDLERTIREIADTGKSRIHQDLKKTIPQGVLELLNIPSIGPKTAKLLYDKLNIESIPDLEKAIKDNKLEGIFGIKEKTIENISKGIELLKRGKERMPLAMALTVADEFILPLKKLARVKGISIAGSLRRKKETVRDIDILASSEKPQEVMRVFVGMPSVGVVLASGLTKSSVRTKDDIQVDLRIVPEQSFGAALLYFTGSKNFNIKFRQIAIKKGLKINEYGVFKKERFIAGKNEEEIFKILGMSYIEPELREDAGEIDLARSFRLPRLIGLKDIKGDLHAHSDWSDGGHSIEEMARASQARGYSYVAITDHSQSLRVAGGLSVSSLKRKKKEIDKINKQLRGFRVLYGTEVEIDSQGAIDYKDGVLKEFDIVIAAIHSGFKQSSKQLTERLVKACKNKYVHIIAHPTGRLWGTRDAYEINMEEVLRVARDTNTALEINAYPERLDLNDLNSRKAKDAGAKLAINTDAHNTAQLAAMQLGIFVARRGWLERKDVINTLSADELLRAIKK